MASHYLVRDDLEDLASGRVGIRSAGDIHGHLSVLRRLLNDCEVRDLGLFLMGDVINRGPDSLGCMEAILRAHEDGLLDMLPGNHEQRLQCYFEGMALSDRDWGVMRDLVHEIDASADNRDLAEHFNALCVTRPVWRIRDDGET